MGEHDDARDVRADEVPVSIEVPADADGEKDVAVEGGVAGPDTGDAEIAIGTPGEKAREALDAKIDAPAVGDAEANGDAVGGAREELPEDAGAVDAAGDAAEATVAAGQTWTSRRRLLRVAALCLAFFAIVLGSQTLSFLARDYPAAGRLTFDGVAIDAVIAMHDAEGGEVPAKSVDEIPIGVVGLDRVVRFENTGAQALWVRARVEFSITADGERHDLADLTTFDVNEGSWVERDGWFYLTEPLDPGELSPSLVTGMKVDTQAANDRYGSGSYQLDAHVGAVQRKHNADSVFDAEGWPE